MEITRQPTLFSPAFGELLYSISDAPEGAEVGIFDSPAMEKIGIKKVDSTPEFTLNVTDYVRSQAAVHPLPVHLAGIVRPDDRLVHSLIVLDALNAGVWHTAGIEPREDYQVFSDRTRRALREGETDEIAFLSEAGQLDVRAVFTNAHETETIAYDTYTLLERSLIAVAVNAAGLADRLAEDGHSWSAFDGMTMEISLDGRSVLSLSYRILPRQDQGVRVCWWNRYGAVDYFTFESLVAQTGTVTRERAAGAGLSLPHRLFSRLKLKAATAYTTASQARWLLQLAAAPKAWLVLQEKFVPVDILTREVVTRSEEQSTLLFEFETEQKTAYPTY